MDRANTVILLFEPDDYTQAKQFIAENLGTANFETLGHGTELCDEAALSGIIIDITRISLPVFASLIALWLGKGKRVKVKRGKDELKLTNIADEASKRMLHDFLTATKDIK